jgi:Zn-dependent protease
LNTSIDHVREGILFIIALVLSIGVHEFGHAWVANRLGDPLPRSQGRLTLNPIRHADPIGTLLVPIMFFMWGGGAMWGWGRPVMTNPSAYTRRFSRPTGSMLVSLAGPGMNLVMALVVSVIVLVGVRVGLMSTEVATGLFQYVISLNIVLLFFNLLPIPPLDGGAILAWVLPRSMQGVMDFLSRWGFLILIGLIMVGRDWIMAPAYFVVRLWLVGMNGLAGV